MWRNATSLDDENIVSMCMALNADDPGPAPVDPQQVRRTLAILRKEPHRGRALMCEINGDPAGYALLISFWSNELGGEVCNIDELFVAPVYRGRGLATDLFTMLTTSEHSLWPTKPVALSLEVSRANERARALYERLGFRGDNLAMRLPLPNK
jgi:ribosomal protein S18 acetylase RimI-like enzyme